MNFILISGRLTTNRILSGVGDPSTYTVSVTCSDGCSTDTQVFTVNVKKGKCPTFYALFPMLVVVNVNWILKVDLFLFSKISKTILLFNDNI